MPAAKKKTPAKKVPAKTHRGKFVKGDPRRSVGRPKGIPNKVTIELKTAIMNAFDKAGGEKYLLHLSKTRPDLFCALLGKVIPLQVNAKVEAGSTFAKLMTEAINVNKQALAARQNGSDAKVINGSAKEINP